MGTLTYLGDEEIDVPLLRRSVKKGDVIDVPDEILTTPELVWPAGVWDVNGASHEFDENSPENVEKREAAAAEAEKAAADAAAAEPATEPEPEPVVVTAADSPVPLDAPAPAEDTAPAHAADEEK